MQIIGHWRQQADSMNSEAISAKTHSVIANTPLQYAGCSLASGIGITVAIEASLSFIFMTGMVRQGLSSD
jgi:hypothetical protein